MENNILAFRMNPPIPENYKLIQIRQQQEIFFEINGNGDIFFKGEKVLSLPELGEYIQKELIK